MHSAMQNHITLEATVDGPIGIIEPGNAIVIDAVKNEIKLELSRELIERRLQALQPQSKRKNEAS